MSASPENAISAPFRAVPLGNQSSVWTKKTFQIIPEMPDGQSFGSWMNICTRRRRVVGRGLHPAVGVAAVLEDELIN